MKKFGQLSNFGLGCDHNAYFVGTNAKLSEYHADPRSTCFITELGQKSNTPAKVVFQEYKQALNPVKSKLLFKQQQK